MTATMSLSAPGALTGGAPRGNPHDGVQALANSSAVEVVGEAVHRVDRPGAEVPALHREAHTAFLAKVQSPDFSCLGARAALHAGNYRLGLYTDLGTGDATADLAHDLWDFVQVRRAWQSPYTTFIACFQQPLELDEAGFEAGLWRQLQLLHEADREAWDPTVSADPDDPEYSFSFAGTAFFVVGLHAGASRLARRFRWPTLVFNAHEQFEQIRGAGKYAGFQRAIQAREVRLQGSLNPNLGEYGRSPESRQYSGRPVDASWRCPMHVSDAG